MPKISILVAVYNAEQYLSNCLDSLIAQSLHDIEIICIDDSSTDHSLSILNKYADKDDRIKLIKLSRNMGAAKARNAGLKIANGEIIAFVDSDDYISCTSCEEIYKIFQLHPLTDTVLFSLKKVYKDGEEKLYDIPNFNCINGYTAFDWSLTWKVHGVYAVRRSIHLKYPYDESAPTYSDDNTTRLHFINSREVRPSKAVYYYRQHSNSVTHQCSIRRFDVLIANESMKRELLRLNLADKIISKYEKVRWLNLIDTYMFYYLHRNELGYIERSRGMSLLKKYWYSIDTNLLPYSIKCKFGYMPLKFSWFLFRMQEELYFYLRSLINKNVEYNE